MALRTDKFIFETEPNRQGVVSNSVANPPIPEFGKVWLSENLTTAYLKVGYLFLSDLDGCTVAASDSVGGG